MFNIIFSISKKSFKGEVFNLGTGINYSINELADMFGGVKQYITARPGEGRTTLADISRTTELTGWKPQYNLADYIKDFLTQISK